MGAARAPLTAAAAFLCLALAQTWPLPRLLGERIAHDPGDPVLVTYLLHWNATVTPLSAAWWHPPFFWPAPYAMTFSEHMLGLSLAATPLQWMGLSALTTYNLLFIESFWLSGMTAWLLARALTGSVPAAYVGGLAFMFAPYRAGQLAHLQLVMTPAVPLLFLALHRARSTSRWPWAAIAAACWIWQGLVSGYHLVFLPIAMVVWLVWFAPRDWRLWRNVGAACAIGVALIAPVLWPYFRVHAALGLSRTYGEVVQLSADLTALTQASADLALWGRWLQSNRLEQDLFPGLATRLRRSR